MSIKYTVRYGTVLTLVKDDPLFLQRTVLYGTAGIRTSTYSVELLEHKGIGSPYNIIKWSN